VAQQQPPWLGDDANSWDVGLPVAVVLNTFDLLVVSSAGKVLAVTPTCLEQLVVDADQRHRLRGAVLCGEPRHTLPELAVGGFGLGPDAMRRAVMGLRGGHCARTTTNAKAVSIPAMVRVNVVVMTVLHMAQDF